jgi:cytochrome c peroxidase
MKTFILIKSILILFTIFIIIGCTEPTNNSQKTEVIDYLKVPPGFPAIPYPADNPITGAKVELGRRLFYEKLLSRDTTMPSCSHCMKRENSFTDNRKISIGFGEEPEYRNTMCLINVAYRKNLFWDGRGSSIESPAYRSIFLKYILGSDTNEIAKRLANHPLYPKLFKDAFGDDTKPSAFLASRAIACFVRTFISGNSRYDQFVNGDTTALTEQEKKGRELFFSNKTRCSVCHSGIFFTDGNYHSTGVTYHYFDWGRYYVTLDNNDRGKFITPTLRNLKYSAPYMHDGTFETLDVVLEHYNSGGKPWPLKDTLIRPLKLSLEERKAIIAFLLSLSDESFIKDKRFDKPADMP